ncbi:MAG: family 10 glycosylhydrolase [Ignavibacteriaceae bacterium]|nr:family 10 glycosylhydrolase [Ignavibacteriaceae bacterium]
MRNFLLTIIIIFTSLILLGGCGKKEVQKVYPEGVRGVWLTNVDSDVLSSKKNIEDAVKLCKESGINAIFCVVWNKAVTMYPSKVMKDLFGVEIDTLYIGRDPLKELIEEAHKSGIKVFAWFEFGFSSSYNLNGGHLLEKKPHWKSLDSKGNLLKKNNFEWMNAFHPEVQEFMISLVTEVVRNYNVDGIQGDDRLPALPSEGGYDEFTVNLYKEAHNGAAPPVDSKDSAWVQWRADLLTAFLGRLYDSVKSVNKNCIVSMSPSVYPWSLEEYLQDWPLWVEKGYVELVCPQLYRYNIDAYRKVLNEAYNEQIPADKRNILYPGVLLKVGSYYPDEGFLHDMILANREKGITGEVFFFYEGLKKYPTFFDSKIYSDTIVFPDLLRD